MVTYVTTTFEVWYLIAQMELDQVFDHFWHLQAETFSLKKELYKNILFWKSSEQNKIVFGTLSNFSANFPEPERIQGLDVFFRKILSNSL